jgi:hypothetical protein
VCTHEAGGASQGEIEGDKGFSLAGDRRRGFNQTTLTA